MDASSASSIDLHCLELRFAAVRLAEPRAVQSLADSIARCGQIVACTAVLPPGGQGLVLVDGYRRIQALRRLGRDTALVETWECDLVSALLRVLAGINARPWAALEEALLLRELVTMHALSQHEVARRCGRDASWVSRRLELIRGLPDVLLAAVRDGTVSIWAATRILAPLARANDAHAMTLVRALGLAPLSTRQLQCWFERYQGSPQALRERLVAHPAMFVEAVQVRAQQRADARLRGGPEAACEAQARQIAALAVRLRTHLPTLATQPLSRSLGRALDALRLALTDLQHDLESYPHDTDHDSRRGAHPAPTRPQSARDCPSARRLAQHGAPDDPRPCRTQE